MNALFSPGPKVTRKMNHRDIVKSKSTAFDWTLLFLFGAAGLLFFGGCEPSHGNEDPVVLIVGDRQVTADVMKQEMLQEGEDLPIPAQHAKQIKTGLLNNIIDRYLILEYARLHGVGVTEAEFQRELEDVKQGYTERQFEQILLRNSGDPAAWLKRFREQILINKVIGSVGQDVAPPDEKELKAYFESNPSRFKAPERVRFRQIFSRSRKKAAKLHERIVKGERLADLAREYSEGPEAEKGGEVGWIMKGTLDETLDRVLFSMAPGDVSPVTKGVSGYHIFQVISRRPGGFQGFSEVIAPIEQTLLEKKRASFYKRWLQDLRTDIRVTINQNEIDKLEFS
jgi:peptidyl-prolyl cis-trans isomerase C